MSDHYDVIIIRSGLAAGRSPRAGGKRILLLERGGWLTREPKNWDVSSVFVDNRVNEPTS